MTADCWVFKFFRRGVNLKHLTCFQRETSVFNFLQLSVDAQPRSQGLFFGLGAGRGGNEVVWMPPQLMLVGSIFMAMMNGNN